MVLWWVTQRLVVPPHKHGLLHLAIDIEREVIFLLRGQRCKPDSCAPYYFVCDMVESKLYEMVMLRKKERVGEI